MSQPRVLSLPYRTDTETWFEAVRDLPYPVWLDGGGLAPEARYDIIAADPVAHRQFSFREADQVAPVLRQWLAEDIGALPGISIPGGMIGYLGYELGRAWQGLAPRACRFPVAAFGRYDWALVVDHRLRRTQLVGRGRALTAGRWADLCARLQAVGRVQGTYDSIPDSGRKVIEATLEWPAYNEAFSRVQHYLREGDIYQVNLTRRFTAATSESPWSLYRRLRGLSPAPHGAYLDLGDFQVLSNSPEQFLQLRDRRVLTRPIKGTRPRGSDPAEDCRLVEDLLASDKDRAENLMIVDLLRNDLGRVCRPGSIEVPALFEVESFATVHHLVSTVRGELAAEFDAVDLLQACFPGGSITGAPKRRAMEVIDELEPVSREVYCGTIFRLGYDGGLESNIAIRTLLHREGELYYWAGGGIVADSVAAAEFREGLDKAAAFFELLGATAARADQSPPLSRW
ncbi:MAG: aminodeoxychorismate synthase component I [Gammaproteobacteria bacterium]|nr:MAG: aminodeoxychorismate synthase component I [Gammaproteobacteria bacterium]